MVSKLGLAFVGTLFARLGNAMLNREPMFQWSKGISSSEVSFAINCGSEDSFTDENGITYQGDRGFSGGVTSHTDGGSWILPNSEVYKSERWSSEDFHYKIPFSQGSAKQTLIIKLSEAYFTYAGGKQFNIALGDYTVAKNLDIYETMKGAKLPLDLFVEIEPRDDETIYVDKKVVRGALTKEGELKVDFKVGKADNPKVNALLLVNGPAEKVTHFTNYKAFRKFLVDLQDEQRAEREKAEALFREDAYDYESSIDGRGPLNQFLEINWALEGVTLLSIVVFLSIIPK